MIIETDVTIITEAEAEVIGNNGRNTNIKRVNTNAVTKVKTKMKATLLRRRIHLYLRGVIAAITRRSANEAKNRSGNVTQEKRKSTKERKELVKVAVAHVVDHRLR